ncbi:hypothetical protein GCM10023149_48520 [Mucilaginibacter gynuensis]|uniref:Head decoration protein n=1 Tax=Mucilaginibacter gynuensis TaxID=1302236 RepID=A0ABP8HF57_9SPHI
MSGLGYKRTFSTGDIPVFQGSGKDIQLAQGGFLLDVTGLVAGAVIKAGTPLTYDESTRKAKPLTTSLIVENAAGGATSYRIAKGSRFKVGDNLAAVAGGAAYPITTIDTSNANYDIVTVGTTIGALNASALVYGSSATGANNSSFGGVNGLLYRDQVVADGESCSVVIGAIVYARRVPYSAALEAALAASSPKTKFTYSQSY